MIRVLLFLSALVFSMFLILYSELTWQLIIVYGKQKLVVNFWFAMLVLLLAYLTVHWLFQQAIYTWRLPNIFRQYRERRRAQEKQFSRGQAIMYALTGDYNAAVGHMPLEKEMALSDLVLSATWLNQLSDINRLDTVLGRIQAMNKIPDGWMVWFRAYLLYERGKQHLACDILLDAIESGIYSAQVLRSFVQYSDPKKHYQALLKHYHLLSRYASDQEILPKLLQGAREHLDTLVSRNQVSVLAQALYALPKRIKTDPDMHYYRAWQLLAERDYETFVSFLMTASFSDSRLIPLVANAEVPMESKLSIVTKAIEKESDNKNLLYLLSYLRAQAGDVDDSVKMLESAINT